MHTNREQEKAHPSMYSTKSSPNINYLAERPSRLSRHHSASSDRSSQRSREKRLLTDHARPHSSSGVFTNMSAHDHNRQSDRRVQEHISKTVRPKHTSFHTYNSRTIEGTKKHVHDDEAGSGTILKPKKVVVEKESQTGTIVKKHGSCRHHHEKGKSVSSKPNKSKVERGIETDEQVKTLERRESAKSREDYKVKMEDRGKAEKFSKKDQPGSEKSSKGSRKGLFGRHSKGHKKEDQSTSRPESSSDKYTTYGTTG